MSATTDAVPKISEAVDGLGRVSALVEAIFMMAMGVRSMGLKDECDALQRVAELAHDEIRRVLVSLGEEDEAEDGEGD